nr:MAG TPA_asm: hypothetical protein [Caudoviricetes sp.]
MDTHQPFLPLPRRRPNASHPSLRGDDKYPFTYTKRYCACPALVIYIPSREETLTQTEERNDGQHLFYA